MQSIQYINNHFKYLILRYPKTCLLLVIFIGIALRYYVGQDRYTNDYTHYINAIYASENIGSWNVYALTEKYNYGPFWFFTMKTLRLVAVTIGFEQMSPYFFTALLSFIDILLIFSIKYLFNWKVALFYWLSPVSIAITGYWRQFDNIALLFVLLSVIVFLKYQKKYSLKYLVISMFLLGISLIYKHIFIIFPIWLLLSEKSYKRWIIYSIPFLLFVGAFVPFIMNPAGLAGIKANVFGYKSTLFSPFFEVTGLSIFTSLIDDYVNFILLGIMLIIAFIYKKAAPSEKLLRYSMFILFFTPALASQYLIIGLLPAIKKINTGFILFIITGGVYLITPHFNYLSVLNIWEAKIMIPMVCFMLGVLLSIKFIRKSISNLQHYLD